ncbi:MAG TPA: glucose 1-dehydrogenase [Tepidisphaeraceae bacterium]|jgi:glucose 1-dehydrogenase/3-oxoacyl-[acyl-carrier protein] reductase
MSDGPSYNLRGKKVLVSGAGTGIGRGIAMEFARQGAIVALHYSHSSAGAEAAVKEISAGGGRARAFKADFTQLAAVQQLGREAVDFLGGIDVLVNNAGITMNKPFEQVTAEQYETLYAVNVRAPFFLTQGVVPRMIEQQSGAIINITSIHAFQGNPDHSVYAGTRGAIMAFNRELAIELAVKNIRVNAIAPGAIEVENYFVAEPGWDGKSFGKNIPIGFVGMPADIAAVACFLASDAARFIVGQTIIVDGGTTSWMPFADTFRQRGTAQFGKGYVPGL